MGVLLFHMDFLLFETVTQHSRLLPRGHLCVDFFFILSGYVIANSYDSKLSEGLSAKAFIGVRVARLWPLVVLTCLVGFIFHIARSLRDFGSLGIDPIILTSLGLNFLMLPAFAATIAFPFNPAAWSIFFEFAINVFYGVFFRRLGISIINSLIALGVAGLAMVAVTNNSLDVGWSIAGIFHALPRVVYSFFVGVVIFRFRENFQFNCPTYYLGALLILSGFFLSVERSIELPWGGLFEFGVVVLFFPMLLVVSINTRLPTWADSLAWLLGGISYSVYLWQTPLLIGYSALPQVFLGQKIAEFIPWAGMAFFPSIFLASYLTWVYFELPAQKWLRTKISQRRDVGAATLHS